MKDLLNMDRAVSSCTEPTTQEAHQFEMWSDEVESKLLTLEELVLVGWSKFFSRIEGIFMPALPQRLDSSK